MALYQWLCITGAVADTGTRFTGFESSARERPRPRDGERAREHAERKKERQRRPVCYQRIGGEASYPRVGVADRSLGSVGKVCIYDATFVNG